MNAAAWLVAWLLAAALVVWLIARGLHALAPGGSGALWCFLATAAIWAYTTWAYRHRTEAKAPQKARRR